MQKFMTIECTTATLINVEMTSAHAWLTQCDHVLLARSLIISGGRLRWIEVMACLYKRARPLAIYKAPANHIA